MCEIFIKINVCHTMTARRDILRWNIDDNETIAFSDQSAFPSSPFRSFNIDSTRLNIDRRLNLERFLLSTGTSRNVISLMCQYALCLVFRNLQAKNIYKNTNKAIFYSYFVNAHRPTKVRYFIFIYISPLPGNKSRHFRLTQFLALNEKGTGRDVWVLYTSGGKKPT